MKKSYSIILTIIMGLNSLFALGNITMEKDSVTLGSGYANDVYYSFGNGEIHSVERQNWDIGFYTSSWSAGIMTNGAASVKLYQYPHSDTSGWNSVDATGISTWPILYNSPDEWENGAFNRNSLGHPDYGWGIYNDITHDVVGDSIFLLELSDGSLKKLWVEKKISTQNIWYFKYADVDGGNEVSEILSFNDYINKNFIYYSLQTGKVIDREPPSNTWDILFTKYMGINNEVPYPVTGALNNTHVGANKFTEVGPDYGDWSVLPLDSTKSPIGYDWKYFDNDLFTYFTHDSVAYFVLNNDKDVYKLVFSIFDYTIGKIVFTKSLVSLAAINNITETNAFNVFPNPAIDNVNIEVLEGDDWENVVITNISGKIVYKSDIPEVRNFSISTSNFIEGLYFVILKSSDKQQVQKLIIQK